MGDDEKQDVRTRRVFYIPGYDPIHPRRYRELYRKESAEQAAISGYEIGLKPRKGDRYGWSVDAVIEGASVHSDVEVLVWSDIVRDSMETNIPATYLQLVRTAWTYIGSGALRRLMWLRKGPVIAALYPVGMLILQLLLAIGGGALAGRFALDVLRLPGWALPDLLERAVWWAMFIGVAVVLLRWFKTKDNKFFAYYLMHDYAYSARTKGANPPELETRISEFTAVIAQALEEDIDEVLVVGHSSGAHLGVSILADLIRQGSLSSDGPKLNFLTLGQVVPMVSFLPKADRLRADLHYLSARPEIAWVDVTAPGDGCAFALCDPVAVSGVAPKDQLGPLVISAAFTQTLQPETWARLRWRFFRLHFQYLCAFDRPGDYDYFQITAGPLTLRDRYKDRKPSQSRIDVSASRYTSMTP